MTDFDSPWKEALDRYFPLRFTRRLRKLAKRVRVFNGRRIV